MKRFGLLLRDRRRRQSGSVLSALLVIVIFLSIMIGALLTELTDSFALSRDLVSKVKTEATVTSAVELAINQLQGGPVPPVCAQDTSINTSPPRPESWTLTLNGHPAAVNQSCNAIVPEVATSLGAGSSSVDGIHDTVAGRNRYLVSDATGRLSAYPFGSTNPSWAVSLGGAATAPPLTGSDPNGSVDILAPAGNKVVVFNERSGSTPVLSCNLPTTGTVSASAAAGANFHGYAVIGDSGRLYVYDAHAGGTCDWRASVSLTGSVVAAPLVFPGRVTSQDQTNSVSDEIFLLVTSGSSTSLQHWSYTESTTNCTGHGEGGDCDGGRGGSVTTYNLTRTGSQTLNGVNAVGYGLSASTAPLNLAVATASGRLDLARISVGSGPSYGMSPGPSIMLPIGSTASRAPFWCHCPGQDLIGVGGTNGFLYLFNNALNLAYSYDGQPDGRPAINNTPMADANGDWYFGANDGSVYDVEIPVSGTQMFKAAKFGPGGAIASSPIVGPCPAGPCLYFASSLNGSYFVRIGNTRISDLRACVSSAQGSTTCAGNPRLWARVQVGPANVWGGSGVFVQGWSFYSP
jgi:hypothetical protein